jgi:hypothetical protein
MQYISQTNVEIFVDYVASDESFLPFSRAEIANKVRNVLIQYPHKYENIVGKTYRL